MAYDFTKFDKSMDLEGLQKDVTEAAANSTGEFKDVPHGDYEIEVSKLELAISKTSKNPMVTCWMKVLEGEYKGSMIFMNQVITTGLQIHFANEFLRSLVKGMPIHDKIKFESYSQYAELILDISEVIEDAREYLLEYGENKGFNTFKIKKVYDLD